MTTTVEAAAPQRRVGLALGVGLALLPVVFFWFLLRPGYSVAARIGWGLWLTFALYLFWESPRAAPAKGPTPLHIDQPMSAPPARQNAQTTARPISSDEINKAYTACLEREYPRGGYVSGDGGKSAMRMMAQCPWEAWVNDCKKTAADEGACTLNATELAQADILLHEERRRQGIE